MTKQSIAKLFVLTAGILAAPTLSLAGTEIKESKEVKQVVETAKESWITGDLGLAVVSEYISRGVVNENQGFIAQPYLDLYFKLYEGDGFLNKISLNLGIWSSIHSNHTFATPGTSLPAWYEFDWTPGLSFVFAKNFTFSASWFDFDFVSSGGRAGNLYLNLAYDDSGALGAFALHPHVAAMKTFIGNGVGVPGGDHAWYYEVGIAPSHAFGPVTITVPLTVGLGNETYAGDDYGFFSAGINASVPLAFVPSRWGVWTATAGFTYWNLGDNAAAASAPALTNGDKDQFVFSGSIGLTF
jgi:hypothetical protein